MNRLILLVGILLCLPLVTAVGIQHSYNSNARTVTYEPGFSRGYSFYVKGADKLQTYTSGDLTEYATIIDDDQNGSARYVRLLLNFPEGDEPEAGTYYLVFGVSELPSGTGTISALTRMQTRITIHVLHEEKFARMSIFTSNVNVNESVRLGVHAHSFSKQDIVSVFGELDIFNDYNEQVGSIRTVPVSLPSKQQASSYGEFSTMGLPPGRYRVRGNGTYDGTTETLSEQTFRIGNLEVQLVDYLKQVSSGGIKKLTFTVESNWNDIIDNVYGIVTMDVEGELVRLDRTPTISLSKFGRGTLIAYWNTENIPLGVYNGNIVLFYGDRQNVTDISVSVTEPEVSTEETKSITITPVVLYFIIAALAVLIAIITLLSGQKRKS